MLKSTLLNEAGLSTLPQSVLDIFNLQPAHRGTKSAGGVEGAPGAVLDAAEDSRAGGMAKQRVLELEEENQELGKRVKHLESHLREREKLLVKAEKRMQGLQR